MRELAGSLVFDVHDAIRDLPGSTPARKILVERALKYLDGLSKESGDDRSLMRELAAAYERVGEVEGHFLQSNLGDAARSLDSYRRALTLRERLAASGQREVQDQLALAGCRRRVANQLWATGSTRGARDEIARAIAVANALTPNMAVLTEEAAEYNLQAEIFGNTEMGGLADPAGALQSVQREEQVVATMLELAPDDVDVQRSYQLSTTKLGDMLQAAGDLPGALATFNKALDLAQRVQQRSPAPQSARLVAVAHNHIAIVQDLLGDVSGSLSSSRASLEIYRKLLSSDPRNALMQRGVAIALLNSGTQLVLTGESEAGLQAVDESVRILRSMVASNPKNVREISTLAGMYEGRGDVRMHLRQPQLAAADYAKACELYARANSADPGDAGDAVLAAECHTRLGRALLSQRKTEAAANDYQEALGLLKPFLSAASPDVDALYLIADSYAGLGDTELGRIGSLPVSGAQNSSRLERARAWYASSAETWRRIPDALHGRSPSLPVDSAELSPGSCSAANWHWPAGADARVAPWTRAGVGHRGSIQLDLHVHARGKLELHEGVHGLVGGVNDIHQALVSAQLELVARILVGVRRDQHGEALHLGRQRHRPLHGRAGTLGGLHDLARGAVDQAMVERL